MKKNDAQGFILVMTMLIISIVSVLTLATLERTMWGLKQAHTFAQILNHKALSGKLNGQ